LEVETKTQSGGAVIQKRALGCKRSETDLYWGPFGYISGLQVNYRFLRTGLRNVNHHIGVGKTSKERTEESREPPHVCETGKNIGRV